MHEVRDSVVDIKKSKLKQQLLKELYIGGPNTIINLSKSLHSSPPSVATLFEELIAEGWVYESGIGNSKSGRKPSLYYLNPNHKYILIWNINKYRSEIVLVTLNHEVLARQSFDFELERNPGYGEFIVSKSVAFLEENQINPEKLAGIGTCMPGLIDVKTGYNHTYVTAEKKPVNELLGETFKTPSFTINDTKAIAFGEKRFGLAKTSENIFVINIDWGVGLGIILNGEIFYGTSGFSGELGHIQIKPSGDLCTCGKVGCLETVTTASMLIKKVKSEIKSGRNSLVKLLVDGDIEGINSEVIIEALNQGDSLCIDLLNEIGTELGKALAIAVHLFNPELIIVDGLLAKAGKFITIPIEQALYKYCLADFRKDLKIEASQLGDEACILGAYAFVLEHIFENSLNSLENHHNQ